MRRIDLFEIREARTGTPLEVVSGGGAMHETKVEDFAAFTQRQVRRILSMPAIGGRPAGGCDGLTRVVDWQNGCAYGRTIALKAPGQDY